MSTTRSTYRVEVDGVHMFSGTRGECEGFAKLRRRFIRTAGAPVAGRVVVKANA